MMAPSRRLTPGLQNNLGAYIQFVKTNNSLLIVTRDEDDGTSSNHIPTIFFGMPVKHGQFGETIDL
jgi:acid phosphatase